MARSDPAKLRLAREIVAGSLSLTEPELMALAYDLREENQIGYARRVYRVALSLAPPLRSSTGRGSPVLPRACPQNETRWLPG